MPPTGPALPSAALRQAVLALWLCGLCVFALAENRPERSSTPAPASSTAFATDANAPAPVPTNATPGVAGLLEGRPLDLNGASATELELLPGIGPRLAERIVSDRRTRGPFRDVAELTRVSGVGPGKLSRVRSLVTVGGEASRAAQ